MSWSWAFSPLPEKQAKVVMDLDALPILEKKRKEGMAMALGTLPILEKRREVAMTLDTLPLLEKVGVITALDTRPLRDRGRGGHGPKHLPSSGKRERTITISKALWPCSGHPLV